MTGKQIANAAEKNEHHVRCPNICRNEMIFDEQLDYSFVVETKVHSTRCSPNPMFIKPVHFMVVFDTYLYMYNRYVKTAHVLIL